MGCIWLKKDGCKGLGGQSVGYWGRDIYKTINAESVINKELVNLRDQIAAGGIRAELWLGVTTGNTCSCYKESQRSADRKCKSCHGVVGGLVPGYLKWGYETLWMSATDDDITLTDVKITTDIHTGKIILEDGKLEGMIESGDKFFNRSAFGSLWEVDPVSFIRINQYSSSTVEYSLDSGSTWKDISNLPIENPVSGVIRFRAILRRDSASVLSPLFEIVRARYSVVPLSNLRGDTYTNGPWIKIMKNVPKEGVVKSEYGDYPDVSGMSFWTVGLSAFDSSIEVGSEAEMMRGPNILIKVIDGAFKDKKFIMIDWALSDSMGFTVVTQSFSLRAVDSVGPMSLVW
jgi:hypothetical protein